jgi:peptidyl-prolyl cis-trans isomerase C
VNGDLSARSRYTLFAMFLALTAMLLPARVSAEQQDRPAAKLDGTVITETQIDRVFAQSGPATQAQRQAALEALITQHLMARQALREHLDRELGVSLVNQREARTAMLAQAYLNEQVGNIAKPTAKAIQSYYDEHPALFSKRATYELQGITVQAGPAQLAAVIDQYNRIKTLNDMVDWLKANKISFKTGVTVASAEQLPGDLLGPVSLLKENQVIKVHTDTGISILQLTGKRIEPWSFSEAKPKIERILFNQALGEKMHQVLLRLKNEATIEYFPPYKPTS